MPSTVIADIIYEAERDLLVVTFTTGRIYEYRGVPADVAAALESAPSKGAFFNADIRDRYACREVTPPR